jgi:hydrogenase nickel incorporation protein HypB
LEIKVVKQILQWNEDCSEELKGIFKDKGVFVVNVMGSPGAGKTTFIMNLIKSLRDKFNFSVIEGDIAGKVDAEKINSMDIPVVQLNTDGACHIEAMSIKNIISEFDLDNTDVLIIENIGNLVCPAEFNIGEDLRVAVLSVPEGDDKPVKYPLMFIRADSLVLNKYDMMDYFDFNYEKVLKDTREMNPGVSIFPVCSVSGKGLDKFTEWLEERIINKHKKQ